MQPSTMMRDRRTAHASRCRPRRASWWRGGVVLVLLACLTACAMTPQPAVLSADDRTALTQVSAYLNNLQRFQATFTQSGPQGVERGEVWLDRPGRMRVEYTAPGPETILANHGQLLVVNPSTGATTTMPVSRTPLDILLRSEIPLSGPVTVTALRREPGLLSVSLAKTDAPRQGTLTLRFSANPLALRGVIIQDRSGRVTALALQDIVRNPRFAPDQFIASPGTAAGPG
ncbi:MAG TPA: outer membrane lipoprotein carrier protein LolA [Acetobacteraceae bacterium]|nr:outer membrane lipoprotein carrier protein LolA [Acetobacteraceae bacterium]